MNELDFLDAGDLNFSSESDFFNYLVDDVNLDELDGVDNVNLIGSVNNYQSPEQFWEAVMREFEPIWRNGNLHFLAAHTREKAIPYYVYYHSDFPIFITTAKITDEMPPTIEEFLESDPNLGRFWLSMEQIERMRQAIIRKYNDVIIPFFTGHRSEYSVIPAEKRGNIERTVSYWADDGRETYKEMRTKYGILPTNIRFERPDHFKFGIKKDGIFTHQRGSIADVLELFQRERDSKQPVKDVINTGGVTSGDSQIFPDHKISASNPWGITTETGRGLLENGAIDTFEVRMKEDRWKFGVSEFQKTGGPGFNAELVDDIGYSRTQILGYDDAVRVYPLDRNDIDSQIRVFNFAQDHFDASCRAIKI